MLYNLYHWRHLFSPLNLFQYITFRSGGAFLTSLTICLLTGSVFVQIVRSLAISQAIRDYGPKTHLKKAGTPTMGGLLILFSLLVSTLLWARLDNRFIWLILVSSVYLGALGFIDDSQKFLFNHPKGIAPNTKMFWQMIWALGVAAYLYTDPPNSVYQTAVNVPYLKDVFLHLGGFYIAFVLVVIIGSSNAVNLTDGLDGLASGTLLVSAMTYAILAYLAGNIKFSSYLRIVPVPGAGEITVFLAGMAGACLGFLWFNSHPAEIFMGDTGSLFLGGTIGLIALCTKQELLLLVVGGIFVAEALSVLIQVTSFRLFHKRIFRMTPLHHHFELGGPPRVQSDDPVLDCRGRPGLGGGHLPQSPLVSLSRRWIKNKRALVVGLGKSGLAAAGLLLKLGARVSLSDKRPRASLAEELRQLPPDLPLETGSHSWLSKKKFDFAVVGPGIPWELPELRAARRRGLPVWNEMGLALDLVQPRRIAAITGTNGKTTTTALLTEMMKYDGDPCVTAGNIGTPLASVVNRVHSQTTLILEVSSYQLEGLRNFNPLVGCLLNITPDHLQRHKTMDRYADIKFSLFRHQGPEDWAVLNADDPRCRRLAGLCAGRVLWLSSRRELPGQAYANREHLVLDNATPPVKLPLPRHLLGPHNIFNALAAAGAAAALGARPSAIARALLQFRGVDHRCQVVGKIRGVLYVNDSKSTNVDSTLVALEAFEHPLFLILGGQHKGSPYTPLAPLLRGRVKKIFLIGEAAPLIRKDLGGTVPMEPAGDLENAVRRARDSARPGDVVLLSPACASFDQFRNFEHRGEVFKELVHSLR